MQEQKSMLSKEFILSKALLPIYTSRQLYNLVLPPEKIYYRIYRKGNEYAVFLLYAWSFQSFPYHRDDYAPVIVILNDRGEVKEVYTDKFHYYVAGFKIPEGVKRPRLEIIAPWRAMRVDISEDIGRDKVMIYPFDEVANKEVNPPLIQLTDEVLHELRSKEVNPINISDIILRNPWAIRSAVSWMTYKNPSLDDIIKDVAKNYGYGTNKNDEHATFFFVKLKKLFSRYNDDEKEKAISYN